MISKLPKLKGYMRLWGLYVSYGRIIAILAAILAAGAVYIETLHPTVVRYLMKLSEKPKILINSVYMDGYSGLAKLVDKNGRLLYEGRLENGAVTGTGKLYSEGLMVYDGQFVENKFNGEGRLYGEEGQLIYEGGFSENLFSGEGVLYGQDGEKLHEGQFQNGQKAGKGRAFDGGLVVYEGDFLGGEYSGNGRAYENGALVYEGGFLNGLYDGHGREYQDDFLVYDGSFSLGLREGKGRLYGKDGGLIYDGCWSRGLYEGAGNLYDGHALLYGGDFSGGLYNGEGREYYTDTGYLKYEGRFLEGQYTASGTRYDTKGRPISKIPVIDPLSVLWMAYQDFKELLKDAELEYKEMTLGKTPVILIQDMGWIFSLTWDRKADAPGFVNAVYFCGLDAVGGALVNMLMPDVISALGPPVSTAGIAPNAVDILALTISNEFWNRSLDAEDARGSRFKSANLEITVFYDNSGDDPGQSLFFVARVGSGK